MHFFSFCFTSLNRFNLFVLILLFLLQMKLFLVLWGLASQVGRLNTTGSNLWILVKVDKTLLNEPNLHPTITTTTLPRFRCAMFCNRKVNCQTFCHNETTNECQTNGLVISPLHKTNANETIQCATLMKKDLAVNKVFTSSPVFLDLRPASNLARGIYNYEAERTCVGLNPHENPWIMVDLLREEIVHEVIMTVQHYGWAPELANNAQIKVSLTPPPTEGNFSQFNFFANFPSVVIPLGSYSVKRPEGVRARYVVLQKMVSGEPLALCYLQIF